LHYYIKCNNYQIATTKNQMHASMINEVVVWKAWCKTLSIA